MRFCKDCDKPIFAAADQYSVDTSGKPTDWVRCRGCHERAVNNSVRGFGVWHGSEGRTRKRRFTGEAKAKYDGSIPQQAKR